VRLQGTERTERETWNVVSRQCTGAWCAAARTLAPRAARQQALTPAGAARVASDLLGLVVTEEEVAALDLTTLVAVAHPALLDPKWLRLVAPALTEVEQREW
jgi:hypothetical protein